MIFYSNILDVSLVRDFYHAPGALSSTSGSQAYRLFWVVGSTNDAPGLFMISVLADSIFEPIDESLVYTMHGRHASSGVLQPHDDHICITAKLGHEKCSCVVETVLPMSEKHPSQMLKDVLPSASVPSVMTWLASWSISKSAGVVEFESS